ncbi:hypothetical protein EDD18DRAFT_1289188 [Armillaria luteobubalina]|uniref:Zn(2)-C6 fungal-type domain-containing protein n=1 Tax=Armillaria luteobubalina TaxID=153913 RepID=A0AA39UQY9_9AGAR|nr:hypothetical protein EDD18DRAFT_1289188 [Armillaria luteobubalina]
MAPIRPHRKSRKGCKICKQRKVKCDEEHPICKNCTKRGIECVWNDVNTLRHDSVLGASTYAVTGPTGNLPSTVSTWTSSSLDVLTLELIHHYATTTSHTLSFDPVATNAWKNVIPKLAFAPENRFLLYAVLAVSALHVYYTDPTAGRYAAAASTYHWQAKSGLHRAQVEGKEDTGAVFIALSLLAMYQFATSSVVSLSANNWNLTVHNITCEVAKIWPQLRAGVLRPLLDVMAPTIAPTREEPFSSSLSTLLSTALSSPDVEELHDVSVYDAYKESIRILEMSWIASYQSWSASGLWWALAPNRFFRLLAEEKPRALIILAHYCVMMKRMAQEGPWWAKKQWGIEAVKILSGLDARWTPLLGWLSSQLDEDQAINFADNDFMNWLSDVASLLNTP